MSVSREDIEHVLAQLRAHKDGLQELLGDVAEIQLQLKAFVAEGKRLQVYFHTVSEVVLRSFNSWDRVREALKSKLDDDFDEADWWKR